MESKFWLQTQTHHVCVRVPAFMHALPPALSITKNTYARTKRVEPVNVFNTWCVIYIKVGNNGYIKTQYTQCCRTYWWERRMRINKSFFNRFRKRRKRQLMISSKEKNVFYGCVYSFGYLSNRQKNATIPHECFLCTKTADCLFKAEAKLHFFQK